VIFIKRIIVILLFITVILLAIIYFVKNDNRLEHISDEIIN